VGQLRRPFATARGIALLTDASASLFEARLADLCALGRPFRTGVLRSDVVARLDRSDATLLVGAKNPRVAVTHIRRNTPLGVFLPVPLSPVR
jgi:hypothetical protein